MRCPVCGNVIPTGPNCQVEDSTSFEWDQSSSPYTLHPILSADSDQLLICGAAGLLAEPPTTLREPPACLLHRSSVQTIANNTLTTVLFPVELYDTDNMHSTSSNTGRITFTTAGTYAVSFNCAWNKNITGDRVARIRKNGTDVLATEAKDSGNDTDLIIGHSILIEDSFAATDYVEALVQQTSGGNLQLMSETYSPLFAAVKVAPT